MKVNLKGDKVESETSEMGDEVKGRHGMEIKEGQRRTKVRHTPMNHSPSGKQALVCRPFFLFLSCPVAEWIAHDKGLIVELLSR